MKIILSRKGFDSHAGGCASPILPDGTMLSLPVPGKSITKYSSISINGKKYSDIIKKLYPGFKEEYCHLDPDIRNGVRLKNPKEWKPAFGQADNAQGQLRNAGVEPGDIFLFFGWFRGVDENHNYIKNSKKRFNNDFYSCADMQVIYGYMQIGRIITDPDEIKKFYWHPHSEDRKSVV